MNTFRFHVSEKEYLESRLELIAFHDKKNRTRLRNITYSILGYAGLYTFMILYFENDMLTVSKIYLMISIAIFLSLQYSRYKFKRNRKRVIAEEYQSNMMIQEEKNVYIDEGRIEFTSASNSIRLEWLDIIGSIKTKNYIVLISPNNQELLLPLSIIGDYYKELKEILKKVKKGKKNWVDDYAVPSKYNTIVFSFGKKKRLKKE